MLALFGAIALQLSAAESMRAAKTSKAAKPVLGKGDSQITLTVGDQKRSCLVHLPPSHDRKRGMAVLIALHCSGGTGRAMADMTGFSAMGDKEGFIAAYPDGIVGDNRGWNALFGKPIPGGHGAQVDDVDDVGFIRELIDLLHKTHHTDPARVFICGHSSGAYTAYRAAIDLPDRIAATGVVNGSLGIRLLDGKPSVPEIPTPPAPVSVIHICGAKDNLVKFEGCQTERVIVKSVPACVEHFVKANECATPGKESHDAEHGVKRTIYSGGKAGTEVDLVVVENCNHNWPFPAVGLSASLELWNFFSKHFKAKL